MAKLTGADFAQLDALYRNNLTVNDTDLRERLNPPEHVTVLLLGGTEVTDEGLKTLANYNQLEWLDLMATRTTDAGLAHIAGLKNLRELWLTDTAVTDDGLAHLSGLTKLERLVVEGTKITPEGLAKL